MNGESAVQLHWNTAKATSAAARVLRADEAVKMGERCWVLSSLILHMTSVVEVYLVF